MNEISQIWKNKSKILEGLTNKIFKNKYVEFIAEQRMNICNGMATGVACPELDTKGDKCLVPLTQPCCSLCGCSLSLKTRSLSAECDLKKWEAVITLEEEIKLDTNDSSI